MQIDRLGQGEGEGGQIEVSGGGEYLTGASVFLLQQNQRHKNEQMSIQCTDRYALQIQQIP
jgi:hypothetical protein